MATGNIDTDLLNTLSNMRDALSDFTDRVSRSYDPVLDSQRRTLQADKDYQTRQEEIRAKQLAGTKIFIDSTLGFAKELTNSAGSFKPLTTAIDMASKVVGSLAEKMPLIGGILKGVVDGVADAAKFIVEQFDQTYKMFEDLSSTGVVAKFDSFSAMVGKSLLTFSDLNTVLGKNSKELSRFGSTALQGAVKFADVAEASIPFREEMQRLGISAAEYREMQIFYMDQEARAGRAQGKSTASLVAGSNQLVMELDQLTKLFGVTRKEQMEQRKALQMDIQYRAAAARLGPGFEKAMTTLQTGLASIDGGDKLFEAFKGIAAGLVPVTKEQQALTIALSKAGINVVDLAEKFRTGGQRGGIEFLNTLVRSGPEIAAAFDELASTVPGIPIFQFTTQFKDLVGRGEITEQMLADLAVTQNDAKKKQKDLNSQLADTRTYLYDSSARLQHLSVSSTIAAKGMSLLASGINSLVKKLYEWAGMPIPEAVKLQSTLIELTNQATEIEKRLQETDKPVIPYTRGPQGERVPKTPEQIAREQAEIDEATRKDKEELARLRERIRQVEQSQRDDANRKPGEKADASGTGSQQVSGSVPGSLDRVKEAIQNRIALEKQLAQLSEQQQFITRYEQSKAKAASGVLVQGQFAINAENEKRYAELKANQQQIDATLKNTQTQLQALTQTSPRPDSGQRGVTNVPVDSSTDPGRFVSAQRQRDLDRDKLQILTTELLKNKEAIATLTNKLNTATSEAEKTNIRTSIERATGDLNSIVREIKKMNEPAARSTTPAAPRPAPVQKVSEVQLDGDNIKTLVAAFKENMQEGASATTDKLTELERTMAGLGSILENIHSVISKTNQIQERNFSYTLA